MRLVIDTNVLISGLLTPFGVCGDIMRLIVSGEVILCVDGRILTEYGDVLKRPRFKFSHDHVNTLLAYIQSAAEQYCPPPLAQPLPDPDDMPFLEVAITADVDALVTGNMKHFPQMFCHSITILTPRLFLDMWRQNRNTNQPNVH